MAGFLYGDAAMAAIVLWSSGRFDTAQIAQLLNVEEDAVYRTLHMAKDGARLDRRGGGGNEGSHHVA